MNNDIIDKKAFNLMSYKKSINDKNLNEKKIKDYENKYKTKKTIKSKIEEIKEEQLKKRKNEKENRLYKIIEYFNNLTELEQIELIKKLKI